MCHSVYNSSIIELEDNTLKLNSGPTGSGFDAGIINDRFQSSNDLGTGDVVADSSKENYALDSVSNNTITLPNTANANNDYYNQWWIKITSGTGSNQVRQIIDYDGTTKIATLDSNFTTNPSSSDTVNLYNKMNVAAAKKLFTVSILYLTLLQITYLIDKMYLWT